MRVTHIEPAAASNRKRISDELGGRREVTFYRVIDDDTGETFSALAVITGGGVVGTEACPVSGNYVAVAWRDPV